MNRMNPNGNQHIGPLTFRISGPELENIASQVKRTLAENGGMKYPQQVVERAVRCWLVSQIGSVAVQAPELLTSGEGETYEHFRRSLDELFEGYAKAPSKIAEPENEAESNVFTGFRTFSAERLGAMAAYIAHRGKNIYKTKLNKLLFYSDFINFHLHGQSISGAKYIHVPFGPVPQKYGDVLALLADSGRVRLARTGRDATLIEPGFGDPADEILSAEERETIEWVLENYGRMSSAEISEVSHREKAYRFTRPGEEIAYRYAAFFETLPE